MEVEISEAIAAVDPTADAFALLTQWLEGMSVDVTSDAMVAATLQDHETLRPQMEALRSAVVARRLGDMVSSIGDDADAVAKVLEALMLLPEGCALRKALSQHAAPAVLEPSVAEQEVVVDDEVDKTPVLADVAGGPPVAEQLHVEDVREVVVDDEVDKVHLDVAGVADVVVPGDQQAVDNVALGGL